jgi:hypothetical protein
MMVNQVLKGIQVCKALEARPVLLVQEEKLGQWDLKAYRGSKAFQVRKEKEVKRVAKGIVVVLVHAVHAVLAANAAHVGLADNQVHVAHVVHAGHADLQDLAVHLEAVLVRH